MCVMEVRLCVCDVLVFVVSFFFQAEDGIRDLVRSRGLGDVYKRQVWLLETDDGLEQRGLTDTVGADDADDSVARQGERQVLDAVSYTHLTLPTSDLV